MEIPQRFPIRSIDLETDDPDAIAAAQPERDRSYHQLSRGRFWGDLVEQSFGRAALLRERWSCGMRVRCNRPNQYLRIRRLNQVHRELRGAGRASVTEVALRFGFFELARFARGYRSLFGELPSETLAESRLRAGAVGNEPGTTREKARGRAPIASHRAPAPI